MKAEENSPCKKSAEQGEIQVIFEDSTSLESNVAYKGFIDILSEMLLKYALEVNIEA